MKVKKFSLSLLVGVILVSISGFMLAGCGEDEPAEEESNDNDAEVVDESDEDIADLVPTDFTSFSQEEQSIGNSSDDAEYTLTDIQNAEMSGYHRFEFELESDESGLPDVEARLVSSGGYIELAIDKVNEDTSGLGFQKSVDVNKNGVLSLYHEVSPSGSEAVFYQIGISEDTIFYLHKGSGLTVLLDVKYPGSANGDTVEDPEELSSSDQTLTGTNTAGDVVMSTYSWAIDAGVMRFTWGTSAASGNPTPGATARYESGKVIVTFTNVERDSVIGADGTFETSLSGSVSSVTGSRSGTTSTYEFVAPTDAEFRVYRNLSPNQVVVEIM